LIEGDGETKLRVGDCAAYSKGSGDGRHTRAPANVTICSDIGMMNFNAGSRFVH